MDLEKLYGASYVNWPVVAESWAKKTLSSRLLLFAARNYLQRAESEPDKGRAALARDAGLPPEVVRAFASVPSPDGETTKEKEAWGEFVDASMVAELEMISYGERPPVLDEVRKGLTAAASEAGMESPSGVWFLARRDALPGSDLPEDPGYIPV